MGLRFNTIHLRSGRTLPPTIEIEAGDAFLPAVASPISLLPPSL